jgi:hypothetical protein
VSRKFLPHFRNRKLRFINGFEAWTYPSYLRDSTLAPPLILLVILLTSSSKVMGTRVSSPLLRGLGWVTLAVMTAAAVGMLLTS